MSLTLQTMVVFHLTETQYLTNLAPRDFIAHGNLGAVRFLTRYEDSF